MAATSLGVASGRKKGEGPEPKTGAAESNSSENFSWKILAASFTHISLARNS